MHAQLIVATLSLAGSVFGGAVSKYSSTSTVTLYSPDPTKSTDTAGHSSACTVCAHPKDYDRNWKSDQIINDTRKHHGSFKLFAYIKEFNDDFLEHVPVHIQSPKDRPDMWNWKLGFAKKNETLEEQPRWNLHDGSLQTDSSAPINDTLYFRLFDAKYPKDTEFWAGTVYHDVTTKHKGKKDYQKEKKAKLVAKKGWSLVRDNDDPLSYILKGSKPEGDFFVCFDSPEDKIRDHLKDGNKRSIGEELASNHELDDADELDELDADDENTIKVATAALLFDGSQIVYSASKPKGDLVLSKDSKTKGCAPLIIKVLPSCHHV